MHGATIDKPLRIVGFMQPALGWTATVAVAPLTPGDGLLELAWYVSPFLPIEDMLAIQGAMLDPQGAISLGWPSRMTVRWQAGSLP